ncbi:uncharacterized protein [Centruroides vittatus]|uniref:uncharacterized protein n=1 Tax=Centruroides vittatus TaxID=120091 RepID=UPI0035103F48
MSTNVFSRFKRPSSGALNLQEQVQQSLRRKYAKKLSWVMKNQKKQRKNKLECPLICWDNIKPPEELVQAFRFGPMFAPKPPKISAYTIVPNIEKLLLPVTAQHKEFFRWNTALSRRIKEVDDRDRVFWTSVDKSKKWLQANDITLTRADKSRNVVLMKKHTYVQLLEEYIRSTECQNIAESFLDKLQNRVVRFTCSPLAKHLRLGNATMRSPEVPRLFGYAKAHKPGKQIRPIVDKSRSPTLPLERGLHELLRAYLKEYSYTVSNAGELVSKLQGIALTGQEFITVLDYEAMYPSIKLEPCFCALRDFLFQAVLPGPKHHKQILELAHLVCYNSFFTFNQRIYLQRRGVPMGSPLSGDLCELVVRKLDSEVLQTFNAGIVLYTRYVDDILIIWRSEPDVGKLLQTVNNNPFGLKLKLDQQDDRLAHFLDLSIFLDRSCITTSVFHKPNLLPFFIPSASNDPFTYKISAYRALIRRAYTHCSNTNDAFREIQHIKRIAVAHGYNGKFIDVLAQRIHDSVVNNAISSSPRNLRSKQVVVDFDPRLSQAYKILSKKAKVGLMYKRSPSIYKLLTNNKDKCSEARIPGVYSVPLVDNRVKPSNKLTYIGSTNRSLTKRIAEHRYDARNKKFNSTLAQYASEPSITAEWEDARITVPILDSSKLRTIEAIEIFTESLKGNCINSRDADSLSPAWRSLLDNPLN